MTSFKYRVRSADGSVQAGLVEAETRDEAASALQERGYDILLLEKASAFSISAGGGFTFLNRITARDLVVVARTLSVMVSASVPLVDAIRNIARQTDNPRLRDLLAQVAGDVESGGKLSDALERYGKEFGEFFINMIRSGETSGQLAEVLEYLADQLEKDYDLNAKIKGAMIYPTFILGGLIVVAFIMMAFVIPKLTVILEEANVALPLSTRILIVVANVFKNYWWLFPILLLVVGFGFRAWISTPGGRYLWDRFKMRIPIFGKLFQRIYVVRFARSLATLNKGGVDLVSALEIVSGVMGNAAWKHLVFATIQEVNDGNSIVTAMLREKYVPPMMIQMLGVGEDTGRIQEVLGRLSSFFSREIDNLVANMVSLIEPAVMILLGVGVGIMVSAILLPLYNLSSAA
ncbi:type II secretion system F family protein [Candidatus Uhrbacteria bacterium]|nr:type II secretion system F family protein [Candidatus Uhrbacteria bacterium]